jgi:polyvinyl alcohol dehydrogenase (cytochrome)
MRKRIYCIAIFVLTLIFSFRITSRNGDTNTRIIEKTHSNFILNNDSTGSKIFFNQCFSCHKDSTASMAPGISIMSTMTPRSILSSLTTGKMRLQGENLSEDDRKAVAEWITKTKIKSTSFPKEAFTTFSLAGNSHSFDHSGWGNDKEGTGFRTGEQSGITSANVSSLKLKWSFAFPDATIIRTKPAIVGDWLITGSQFGDVYALNKNTGKIGWHFAANAAIRGAISVVREGNSITAFFSDFSTNVYALDVRTGKMIWNKRAGFDPQSASTGSVIVYNGKVFIPISSVEVAAAFNGDYKCCLSSGGVVALDAKTGNQLWQYRVVPKATESGKTKNGKPFYGPSGAPVWCSPTIDSKRGLLFIGTGQNYSYPPTNSSDALQALDIKTGKLVWNFQATVRDMYNVACPFFNNCPDSKSPDFDFGMAPILVKTKAGKEILVAGQKSGIVYALSPDKGKLIWKTRVGKGGKLGGVHWGMASDKNNVFVANSDNINAVDKSDSSIQPSPGIYSLDVITGNLVWKTSTPVFEKTNGLRGNSAAPAVIPGIVFAGALDGHIRAYSTENGKILWDFDTVTEYECVNGFKGKGGAIDGPAPVIAGGMLFVNSGYGMFGQTAGNVLLAFEIDDNK